LAARSVMPEIPLATAKQPSAEMKLQASLDSG
jgi:hypothetical protein